MTNRTIPHSREAERAVLGAMLLNKDAIDTAVEMTDEGCFYDPKHKIIFSTIVSMYDKNEPADITTLPAELIKRKSLDKAGGRFYILNLAEGTATAANIEYHCNILLEKATLRNLIDVSTDILSKCYTESEESDILLDNAEQKIFNISERKIKHGFVSLSDILPQTFDAIDRMKEGTMNGLATGFEELDALTMGLQGSDLVVVAGRPSMGKTAFVLTMAQHVALNEKIPVGIFSLEMGKAQLANRLLCGNARISSRKMRSGRLGDEDWTKISIAIGPLSESKILIDDTPAMGIMEMRAKARRLKSKEDVGLVIVDYLQLMQGPKGIESRQQEIALISRGLKSLAKDLDVPVIACSQLSRAVEMRGGEKRPHLADLRESGAIEQDADLVIFIYRPELYGIKNIDYRNEKISSEGIAEIMVAKHRNGPTGSILLSFVKQYARFENLELRQSEVPF